MNMKWLGVAVMSVVTFLCSGVAVGGGWWSFTKSTFKDWQTVGSLWSYCVTLDDWDTSKCKYENDPSTKLIMVRLFVVFGLICAIVTMLIYVRAALKLPVPKIPAKVMAIVQWVPIFQALCGILAMFIYTAELPDGKDYGYGAGFAFCILFWMFSLAEFALIFFVANKEQADGVESGEAAVADPAPAV
jgi:hypothetical protein